ncbi:MAG: hypothetical protein J0L75_20425 [Spirochaetes bacterium]|nr:hypothetical protein [Spirochaetota bacterium]
MGTAILLAILPFDGLRRVLVWVSGLTIAALSIYGAWAMRGTGGKTTFFQFDPAYAESFFLWGGIVLAAVMLILCRRITKREWWIPVLVVVQEAVLVWLEAGHRLPAVKNTIAFDGFTSIMTAIIGVVGSLICIYALGYMKDYHHHHAEMKDRRRSFFFTLFLFLSAMFGVVFANNLSWMYFFWEITTLCSFLLIGYSREEQATRNAYRAMGLNALGGLGFVGAIAWLSVGPASVRGLDLMALTGMGALALLPACLLAFAGLAKAAQLPFSSWLLGAMVAPTPVSALLHSSTMVKAGVYLIVRFAPVFQGTVAGQALATIGAATFLITSLIAITQSNAKRVLAYSTIANLGLIVACAGIGTPEATWAAVLLIIFHAVSKGLLFLTVGTTEHKIGSRDIEDMEGLLVEKPFLAVAVLTGIAGMFLAPFGMLISKWACMKAFIDGNPLLAVLLAFGSAPTLFFWTKWMGKVVSIPAGKLRTDYRTAVEEKASLGVLAVLTAAVCILFPVVSWNFIEPYLRGAFAATGTVEQAILALNLSGSTLAIMLIMLGFIGLLPISVFLHPLQKPAARYLAGVNREADSAFTGALATQKLSTRNYYLSGFFSENVLTKGGIWVAIALLALLAAILWMQR